jgi:hypothetical protein
MTCGWRRTTADRRLLVLIAAAVSLSAAGCGVARPQRGAAPLAAARAEVQLLRSGHRADRTSWALIAREIPAELPRFPSATVRVPSTGVPPKGQYWLAPGVIPTVGAPAICEYFRLSRRAGVGTSCFRLSTVRSGRAVEAYRQVGGTDVTGVVPSDAAAVEIRGAHARVRLHPTRGAYATWVPFELRSIIVIGRGGRTRRIRFGAA